MRTDCSGQLISQCFGLGGARQKAADSTSLNKNTFRRVSQSGSELVAQLADSSLLDDPPCPHFNKTMHAVYIMSLKRSSRTPH